MRGPTWRVRLVSMLLCVLLVAVGCGADATDPAEPNVTRIRVALFPAGSTLPAHAAMTEGIFERHGLQVDVTEGTDLPLFMAALAKNQYDIVMSGPTLALIAAEKHLDLQIIAGLQRQTAHRPNAVWITGDPSITTLTQLKGRTIAVPSLTGLIIDALMFLLGRSGLRREDVKLIATPFPTMGDQLAAGHVDAAVATIPFYTAMAARGFHVHDDVVVDAVREASGGAVDTAVTSVWLASRPFVRDHPETVAAWRKSLSEATDLLNGDESQARGLMESWLKFPAEVIAGAPLPQWTVEMTPQELAPYVTISKAVGSTTSDPDVKSLVWQGQ